jgi:hypothetical protein
VTGPETVVQAPADQVGRLDYHLVDFDYVSREWALGPRWDMTWGIGVRGASLYFDSRIAFLNPASDPGTVLSQSESNSLWSLGAHGVFELSRRLPISGASLFGRIDAAGMWGRIAQTGKETSVGNLGEAPDVDARRFNLDFGNPMASVIVGVSYAFPQWNHSRILLGYSYETWWEIGRNARVGTSVGAQLDTQGVFLRGEFNF